MKRLDSILTIGSGKDYKHLKPGNIPVYGTGGYISSVDDFLYDGVSIGIGRKGTIDKPILLKGKFWTVDTLFYTYSFNGVRPRFLYSVFQNIKWKKYNEASGVPSLSKSTIEKININIPSLEEQEKISSFLTLVDDRIETQNKIIEDYKTLKKGMVQKTFKQELRFKDENSNTFESWKEKRLGEFLIHKSKRNKKLEINQILSVSNSKGFILQSQQFDNHRVASKDVTNYKIVKKNDIAYNPSRINVGSIAILKDYEKGIVSPMYVVFGLKDSLELSYFENLITTHLFNHLVRVGCSGSVRDSLNFEDLESFKLKFPCLEEQQKIAATLSAIDKKIALEEDYLDKLKAQKKYLLQNLFI